MLQTRHITASLLRRGVGICAVRSRRVGTTDGAGASVDDRSVPTEFKNVFADKPTSEIVRALFVFKMCTYDVFVRNSLQLMTIGERLAGRRLFMWTMRRTFYGQFVGGETAAEIEACKAALESAGVRAIMCVPIEEDTDAHIDDIRYDGALKTIMGSVRLAGHACSKLPVAQLKLTAIVPGATCGELSGWLADPHAARRELEAVASALQGGHVHLQLSWRNGAHLRHLEAGVHRFREVCQLSASLGVRLLVDAEYIHLNPALRFLSLAAMMAFNTDKPIVAYTYQNYLKKTYKYLEEDLDFTREVGVGFGAKLVRGAYMISERRRAAQHGYEVPLHPDFHSTTAMYEQSVERLLDQVAKAPEHVYFMIATHNAASVSHAQEQMAVRGLKADCSAVLFGQLYGMADHLSCKLAQGGYLVYKSVPYGRLVDTLPYLQRRAVENSSMLGGTGLECRVLQSALRDRLYRKRTAI